MADPLDAFMASLAAAGDAAEQVMDEEDVVPVTLPPSAPSTRPTRQHPSRTTTGSAQSARHVPMSVDVVAHLVAVTLERAGAAAGGDDDTSASDSGGGRSGGGLLGGVAAFGGSFVPSHRAAPLSAAGVRHKLLTDPALFLGEGCV